MKIDTRIQRTGHALIVGAGIAGLTAAWWLKRAGWQVTILEKRPNVSANGYLLSLSGPGYSVARKMNILGDLKQLHKAIDENYYFDHNGKEILKFNYLKISKRIDWVTLTRAELAKVIYEKVLQKIQIKFSTTLLSYQEKNDKVIARLSDGSELTADVLIGADGARSALRKQLFHEDEITIENLGYRVAAFNVRSKEDFKNNFMSYSEPSRLAQFFTFSKTHLTALYIWKDEAKGQVTTTEDQVTILSNEFQESHPFAKKWIDDVGSEQSLYFDEMAMVCMNKWSKGRVVLLGDAAHCLTLLSGQGAGIAMTSAYLLSRSLIENDVMRALDVHESLMRPSVTRLQERSRKMALWFIPKTKIGFDLRNIIMKRVPEKLLLWYFFKSVKSDILAAKVDL
ncbi:MAG: FAD-dependent oxidoreductase [Arenicella sp.]